jgi:peroxiredoxin
MPREPLAPGTQDPDFELRTTPDQKVALSSLIEYGEGVAARALFVLDRRGKIVWSYVAPIGINPGVDGILDALEELEARKEMIHA